MNPSIVQYELIVDKYPRVVIRANRNRLVSSVYESPMPLASEVMIMRKPFVTEPESVQWKERIARIVSVHECGVNLDRGTTGRYRAVPLTEILLCGESISSQSRPGWTSVCGGIQERSYHASLDPTDS